MQRICIFFLLYMIVHATDLIVSFNLPFCDDNKTCETTTSFPVNESGRTTSLPEPEVLNTYTEGSKYHYERPRLLTSGVLYPRVTESQDIINQTTSFPVNESGRTTSLPEPEMLKTYTERSKYHYGRPRLLTSGVLYPRVTESRDIILLDGIWSFILGSGVKQERLFEQDFSMMPDAILMPVPSSYNDITTKASVRDHIGLVWYQRTFFIPKSWKTQQQRVWMRFGSVHYFAQVWINGKNVMEHEIGHLPFQEDITDYVRSGKNTVTVSVDNRLGPETVPQGTLESIEIIKDKKEVQKYSYDFYNYAGIHGPVHLYTTPRVYIDNVCLKSEFSGSDIYLLCNVSYKGANGKENINVSIEVIEKDGHIKASARQIIDGSSKMNVGNVYEKVKMNNVTLWWPYLMHSDPGYLYTVRICLVTIQTGATDIYTLPFGFRDLRWNNESIFINNKPIYIRGTSRHEDFDVRGRGLDLATSVKDLYLMKWIGFNTYRTSHCPHSEEVMDIAEKMGFMVIDEVPSINTQNFTDKLLTKHRIALEQLINRDKNRACVIMWSVANEPESEVKYAGVYFGSITLFTRQKDNTRPITAILNRWNTVDLAGQWMDVICFNRYNGYFKEPGHWEFIQKAVETEATYWHKRHSKPVIMSEYGTETYEGLHGLPDHLWTEEYQSRLFSEHFKAFDNLRVEKWFIGEFVYSFADFKTHQSPKRVGAEQRKGIFNRHRQPKSSAFHIRKRNFMLATTLDESPLPSDLNLYLYPQKKEISNYSYVI